MSGGRRFAARAIAACTSCAAASMFRLSSKSIVMLVLPCTLDETIDSMPAIVENSRSSGVATDEAIVSGFAPGRLADTAMVGRSMFGRSLTGRKRYPMIPKTRIPTMTSVVMTGRRMNKAAIFMRAIPARWPDSP